MSGPNNKESKESVKRRNAQPERAKKRQAQGNIYMKTHPDRTAEYRKRSKQKHGSMAEMVLQARDPLTFTTGDICLACDFHIPFQDEALIDYMIDVCEDYGIKELAIDGDFFDCDNLSSFNSIVESELDYTITWNGEKKEVQKMLVKLLRHFDTIYMCSGNHENRWVAITGGKGGFKGMIKEVMPENITIEDYRKRVKVTIDTHMILNHKWFDEYGEEQVQEWLLCHPRNFSILPLRVSRDLAARYLKNIHMAHGHNLYKGHDRSGKFICLDGGGLFDKDALAYASRISTHPAMKSGFYLLVNGEPIQFEGK